MSEARSSNADIASLLRVTHGPRPTHHFDPSSRRCVFCAIDEGDLKDRLVGAFCEETPYFVLQHRARKLIGSYENSRRQADEHDREAATLRHEADAFEKQSDALFAAARKLIDG